MFPVPALSNLSAEIAQIEIRDGINANLSVREIGWNLTRLFRNGEWYATFNPLL